MKTISRDWAGLLAAGLGVWLAGCATTSHETARSGVARITGQPIDISVGEGTTATFTVKAEGRHLTYQWYRNNFALPSESPGFRGVNAACLRVEKVGSEKLGFYHCEIGAADAWGNTVLTQTRSASLGYTSLAVTMAYPPQHAPMPPARPGTSPCGAYCGYVIYNNNGTGFQPASGQTRCRVSVSSAGKPVPNGNYAVMWRASATSYGCMSNVTGSTTQKGFTCAYPTRYVFTVYFTPNACPPAGTDVVLEPVFQ